jgi:phosphatidylglycerophosphatase A
VTASGTPGPTGQEENRHPASLSDRLLLLIATGFGLGHAPFAPGTVGSLAGLPFAWGLEFLPLWGHILAAGLCFLIGIPICAAGARQLGVKDPGGVVFDEIAAFGVVFLVVPFNLLTAVPGFVLFRLFDVWKPWPARRLERLPGGLGIMADDFAAGLYAAASLWLGQGLIARCLPLG